MPGSRKNPARIAHLLSLDADLILLTETHACIDLGPAYRSIATDLSPRKPRPGESVATIWYRVDSVSLRSLVPTSDPREAVCGEFSTPYGDVLVYASIIPYHGYRGADGTAGAWEEHLRAIEWHRVDWASLRLEYPKHGIITGGDYNQTRDGAGRYGTTDARNKLSRALMRSGLRCVTEEDLVEAGKLAVRHSVDHICLSADLADWVHEVSAWEGVQDKTKLSDHNGVVVSLAPAPLRDTAIHEAGHAVAMTVLGVGFDAASIRPTDDARGHIGLNYGWGPLEDWVECSDRVWKACICTLSGEAASLELLGRDPEWDEGGRGDFESIMNRLYEAAVPEDAIADRFEEYFRSARLLVHDHSESVLRIAHELDRREVLTGSEVRALVFCESLEDQPATPEWSNGRSLIDPDGLYPGSGRRHFEDVAASLIEDLSCDLAGRTRDCIQLVRGEVHILVTPEAVEFRIASAEWFSSHEYAATSRLHRRIPLDDLSAPGMGASELLDEALAVRRAEYRRCRGCTRSVPVEQRYDDDLCHSCASHLEGIVF